MKPIFSIIIPCYNVSDFVDNAIQSCLTQNNIDSDDFEIIAINDGSTDDTYIKLQKYSEYQNVTIVSQTNSGLSRSRNRGIELSKGDYILFLDGDDWFSSDALCTLKPYINKADIIIFPMEFYYDETKRINNSLGLKEGHIYDSEELLRNTIGKSQFQSCPAPTKCYKASILKDNNQLFIPGILHEDGPFYLETLFNAKTILYVEKYIYHYRLQRPGSITTVKRTWRNVEGIIKGTQHTFEIYGYRNKDINYYYLTCAIMQVFQRYQTKQDYVKVINYYSRFSTRKFLAKSLFNFRFDCRTFALGLLLLLSPKMVGYLYSTKHKLY